MEVDKPPLEDSAAISAGSTPALHLVHRLAYNDDVIAFKMGGRLGRRRRSVPLASSERAKRGRFAYMAQPPIHSQHNPPGRGPVGCFSSAAEPRKLLSCLLAARWEDTKAQMKTSPLGFQSVKVIALAATDVARARRFYSEALQLEEDRESTDEVGYRIGDSVLVIRQHPPTDNPNPRVTLQVQDARETEKRLTERAVTISDRVQLYDDKFWVGGFLDSGGNKLWFCSCA